MTGPLNLLRRRPLYVVRTSVIDGLTGLPVLASARVADEVLEHSGRGPSCLALVAVDELEPAHRDTVIRAMAVRARDAIRDSDVLALFGTDRFLVVLSGTEADGAMIAADRVRADAARMPVTTGAGPVWVTASVGVAEIGADESLATAISRAESSLLRARAAGGDLVVLECVG